VTVAVRGAASPAKALENREPTTSPIAASRIAYLGEHRARELETAATGEDPAGMGSGQIYGVSFGKVIGRVGNLT
jgi:hypothetical protein